MSSVEICSTYQSYSLHQSHAHYGAVLCSCTTGTVSELFDHTFYFNCLNSIWVCARHIQRWISPQTAQFLISPVIKKHILNNKLICSGWHSMAGSVWLQIWPQEKNPKTLVETWLQIFKNLHCHSRWCSHWKGKKGQKRWKCRDRFSDSFLPFKHVIQSKKLGWG